MRRSANDINLVLITEDSTRASMLRDAMTKSGVNGVIRRIDAGAPAVDCARQKGTYSEKPLPDLFFLDFTEPTENSISVLKAIAFGDQRTSVPVVLITSPHSQELLDSGSVAEESSVMFSPTSLSSFIRKMKIEKRPTFFKALHTLYQYGPILVRPTQSTWRYSSGPVALPA